MEHVTLEIDLCNLIQKSTVFQFSQTMMGGARLTIDRIPCIGLGNVNSPAGVDGHPVEQGPKRIHCFNQFISRCIKNKQISIRNLGMFHDIHDGSKRKHVVIIEDMFSSVKGGQFAIQLTSATRNLCLVI